MSGASYTVQLSGHGASIEDIRRAYAARPDELKKLTPGEEAWIKSMGLDAEEYQRQRLAESYYEDFVRNVISTLVDFVEEEFQKSHVDFKVNKIVYEFDRRVFKFFVQRKDEIRSFRISWEDGTDYFEGKDVVAEQHIGESVRTLLQVSQEAS